MLHISVFIDDEEPRHPYEHTERRLVRTRLQEGNTAGIKGRCLDSAIALPWTGRHSLLLPRRLADPSRLGIQFLCVRLGGLGVGASN